LGLVATLKAVQSEGAERLKLRRIGWSLVLALVATVLQDVPNCVAGSSQPPAQKPSPAELVRAAVDNEIAASKDTSIRHMFRSRRQTPRGSQTRLYVETRDAMAAITIAYNDHVPTPEQIRADEGHLQWLLNNPDQLRHKHSQEKEDADHTLRIVKALPDAFLYDYDPSENNAAAGKTDSPVRLNFRPNPSYSPPSRVEQVLAGMRGFVVIDPVARRIVKIDGTLFRDVTFGWGLLGHLDKGGHFEVQQADVGDGTWEITRMSLKFTGKIILFKGISIVSDEVFSDFRRLPADLTFAQGVKMLETEQAKLAPNGKAEAAGNSEAQR
jgi:hypothetical protein